MRMLLSLALLFLTTVVTPTLALPSTPVVCDITTGLNAVQNKHSVSKTGGATQLSVSSTTVTTGGTTTISLQGSFSGFLLYVKNAAGTHVGTMTPTGANVGASSPCTNGAPAGTTVGHNSATTKTAMSWTWTAPATAGTYQAVAMVAEGQGVPPIFEPTGVLITVQAAQPATQAPTQPPATQAPATQAPKATTPPATNTNTNPATTAPAPAATTAPATNPATTAPASTTTTTAPATGAATAAPVTGAATAAPTPSTVQQLLNMVKVQLKAFLNGTGSLAQLKTAIQNLVKQLQAAVQKAKAAKGSKNANKPVPVVVTQAAPAPVPATTVAPTTTVAPNRFQQAGALAAGATVYSIQLGFVNPEDAQAFADSLTQAASLDNAIHSQSALLDGDVTSQLQYDPAGLDAQGNVIIAAATVGLVTCPDGTQVSQDLQPMMCPAADPMAAGTTTTTTGTTAGMSNGMFIGLIIGGIAVLLLGVGGFVYYQKSKQANTVKPRV